MGASNSYAEGSGLSLILTNNSGGWGRGWDYQKMKDNLNFCVGILQFNIMYIIVRKLVLWYFQSWSESITNVIVTSQHDTNIKDSTYILYSLLLWGVCIYGNLTLTWSLVWIFKHNLANQITAFRQIIRTL